LIPASFLFISLAQSAQVSIVKDKEKFLGGTGGRIATVLVGDEIGTETEEIDRYWEYGYDVQYYQGEESNNIYTLQDTIIVQAYQPNEKVRAHIRKVDMLRCYIQPERNESGEPTNLMFKRAMHFISTQNGSSGFTVTGTKNNSSDCLSFQIHSRSQAQVLTMNSPWSGPRIFLDPATGEETFVGHFSPSEHSSISVTHRKEGELIISGTVGKSTFHCSVKPESSHHHIYNTFFNSPSRLTIFEIKSDDKGDCRKLKLYNSHWSSYSK